MSAVRNNTNEGTVDFVATDFRQYLNGIIHEWLRTLTALGCALIPAFFILDYFTMPKELLPRFGYYRLISTVIMFVQWLIIRRTNPSTKSLYHAYIVSLHAGCIIVLMTVDLGGFNSRYYAGLNLVIMGVNLLLPWRAFHAVLNSGIVIAMYVVINLAAGADYSPQILANNLFFLVSTALIAIAINHLRHNLVRKEFDLMVELKKARDALWSEMEIAKHIQTALLPNKQNMTGYEVAATMLPAKEVGGDYYDILEAPDGAKWVLIGDVSGHGVDSGLIMMMAQTSVLSMVNDYRRNEPSVVLKSVNAVLRENISRLGSDHYMTMTAFRFNGTGMTLSGRHQDIIIYRAQSNRTEVVPTRGTWLGISDNLDEYLDDMQVNLDDGDLVLLYTDGVTEAMNKAGEMFGEARLEQALNQYADLPVAIILEKLMGQVTSYQMEQSDDMTLIVIKKSIPRESRVQ